MSQPFDFNLLFRFFAALAAVIALMIGSAWLLRRFAAARGFGPLSGRRRLAVIETAAIDTRSRLVLVRRDDREHLLLLSQGAAVVVESGIAAPSALPAPPADPPPGPPPGDRP